MPSITMEISPQSQLHERILSAIKRRHDLSRKEMQDRHHKWRKAEDSALAYMHETDVDASRRAARDSGRPQYTTLTVPYSYAMLMTAHTYWTSVFLGRTPVYQFTGRHGEGMQQVQAMEALADYQLQVGEQLVPLYIWLYDVGKYGIGIVNVYWEQEEIAVSNIVEEDELIGGIIPTGRKRKKKLIQRIPGYEGNKLFNIRPFDWYPDTRVPLNRFQDGEFVGVYAEVGWNRILKMKTKGYYMNTDELRNTKRGPSSDHDQGSPQLELPDIEDWVNNPATASSDKQKGEANFFGLFDYYIELVPSEWGLGKSDYPEVWQFTCSSDFKLLIGARPQGAIHGKFPFSTLEYEVEGYAVHSRGMSEVLDPIQRTIDWLINSHFYNVRKALNNQVIVDPSRLVMKDVLNPRAGGVWRLKPSAYGTDVRTAYQQLQITDVTRTHLTDINFMHEFGQRVVGIPDTLMGVTNRGGRRSATEARTDAGFGINRQKTLAELFSAQGFAPLSQMMVQNSQQYYETPRKLRIVGDLINDAGAQFINVAPEDISGFFDFVPVDGTMPVDRFAQANLWRDILAGLRNMPMVAQTYDVAKIFAWAAKLAGLKNIDQFKIQVAPDQQVAQQAAGGNLVPLANPEAPSVPAQTAGVGPVG